MKKTILSIAATLVACAAMAGGHSVTPATGTVSGVATSQSQGSVSSGSVLFGINKTADHRASAFSQNCTTVFGAARPGTNGATADTSVFTLGSTLTKAGGNGPGFAYSDATQYGFGSINSVANVAGRDTTGVAEAASMAVTGTFSSAGVVDTGFARSGTSAEASNESSALAGSNSLRDGASALTKGSTVGKDSAKTFGDGSAGAITNAGGSLTLNGTNVSNVATFQAGSFNAAITRNVSVTNTGVDGPKGCVTGSGNGCKD